MTFEEFQQWLPQHPHLAQCGETHETFAGFRHYNAGMHAPRRAVLSACSTSTNASCFTRVSPEITEPPSFADLKLAHPHLPP